MGKIRVLIVDDNNDFCVAISDVIKSAKELDMELAGIARNGTDACNMIISKQPDLVLLDNVMPGLDGIGVVETVNEAKLENPPKIISYTSMCSEDFVKAMFHLGVNYCMNKETDVYQILLRGQMLVNNGQMHEPSMEYLKGKSMPSEEFPAKAADILHKLGVPVNLKGYEYLIKAICIAAENSGVIKGITKRVYPPVAEIFETDRNNVERAIRHAIKVSWERGDKEAFGEFFNLNVDDKPARPTNSEFIAVIAQYVRGR